MWMGRERGVLRWDVHATLLTNELEQAQAALAALPPLDATPAMREQRQHLMQECVRLRHRLDALGPSPRAKMG